MSRYAFRRKDANHNTIAKAFSDRGYSVHDTSKLGDDFPDMLVAKFNINVLVEVKRDAKDAKLSEGQFKFFTDWKGWTVVCKNVDDVQRIDRLIFEEASNRRIAFSNSWKNTL